MDKLAINGITWDRLKRDVYHEDGSLRDIYVLNTTRLDWGKWISYVNNNCSVTWIRDESEGRKKEDTIDYEAIVKYWDSDENYESHPATISLGEIHINVFFFW